MLVADAVTGEIGMAGRFVSETLIERLQGSGEVGASHARTLPIAVFGVNPIGSKAVIGRYRQAADSAESLMEVWVGPMDSLKRPDPATAWLPSCAGAPAPVKEDAARAKSGPGPQDRVA